MQAKTVSESKVSIIHHVMPPEANQTGNMHGGQLLKHMDAAGAICAFRHARGLLVTAAVEHMEFIAPVKPGDILTLHCSVNYVRRTSMEVGLRIEAEEYLTGKVTHVSTCYMTFVGIDESGNPRQLPPLIAETDEEKRRMADGARRMALSRMGSRKKDSFIQRFHLTQLPGSFAICRMSPDADLPAVPPTAFMSMTRTPDEVCFVIPEAQASLFCCAHVEVNNNYLCLKVDDNMPHERVGILASITAILASASIPVFAVSTTTTNYILFPAALSASTMNVLRSVGHVVRQADDPAE